MPSVQAAPGSEPVYTQDWTTWNVHEWTVRLAHLRDRPARVLEIGAFEGRTTRFLLELLPQALVTVIDTFQGGDDQRALALEGLADRFAFNVAPYLDRVHAIVADSRKALPHLIVEAESFDVIYIDGSHWAADVLFDAVCAYHLLNVGGRLCFDDVTWSHDGYADHLTPKSAVEAFMRTHADRMRVVGAPGRQLWAEKTR